MAGLDRLLYDCCFDCRRLMSGAISSLTPDTTMSRTLPAARAAFVAAMKRDTTGAELSRLVAVLDALIKWSVSRPQTLSFQDGTAAGVLSFECVESKEVCWSARVTRGDAPKLELYPRAARSLSPETRAKVVETFNTYARQELDVNDRLRIGFGALKNARALAAVTTLLGELLATNGSAANDSAAKAKAS